MALTIKSLAAGVIKGTAPQTVVILPGSTAKGTLVTSIYLTNLHTGQATLDWVTVQRYIASQAGYQDFRFFKGQNIAAGDTLAIKEEITLGSNKNNADASAPDQIKIQFSTIDNTNGVSYVINGIERDV